MVGDCEAHDMDLPMDRKSLSRVGIVVIKTYLGICIDCVVQ